MAHSIALKFFHLPPLLFVWWVFCNWQRTPSHVSIQRLSFYNMFFILAPQWGYLILGYGMWLSVMRLLGGCFCLNQSGGLTSVHSVTKLRRPLYPFTFPDLLYWGQFSSTQCHRYYLFNSHILSLSPSVLKLCFTKFILHFLASPTVNLFHNNSCLPQTLTMCHKMTLLIVRNKWIVKQFEAKRKKFIYLHILLCSIYVVKLFFFFFALML